MKRNLIPHSLCLSLPVFLVINIGLVLLDWKVLSSLFVTFSNEDSETISSGTMILAIAIDATVMIIAHILSIRLRNATLAKICVIALILAFVTAVTGMGLMRITNADTIFESADTGNSVTQNYFESKEIAEPAADAEDIDKADNGMKRLNLFTQILFTLSPIFTSVVAFCLSCLRSGYKLKLDIQKIEQHIQALNAEALTIKNATVINDFEAENDGYRLTKLNQCLSEVDEYNQRLKRNVREIYISYCNVPEHIHYARSIAVTASPAYYPTRISMTTAPPEKPSSEPDFQKEEPAEEKPAKEDPANTNPSAGTEYDGTEADE